MRNFEAHCKQDANQVSRTRSSLERVARRAAIAYVRGHGMARRRTHSGEYSEQLFLLLRRGMRRSRPCFCQPWWAFHVTWLASTQLREAKLVCRSWRAAVRETVLGDTATSRPCRYIALCRLQQVIEHTMNAPVVSQVRCGHGGYTDK